MWSLCSRGSLNQEQWVLTVPVLSPLHQGIRTMAGSALCDKVAELTPGTPWGWVRPLVWLLASCPALKDFLAAH